jgi:hypothetical protein
MWNEYKLLRQKGISEIELKISEPIHGYTSHTSTPSWHPNPALTTPEALTHSPSTI